MNLFKRGKTEETPLVESGKPHRAPNTPDIDRLWGAYRRLQQKLEDAIANTENRLRILEKERQRDQVAGSRAKKRLAESAPPQNGADDTQWERLERQIRGG